MEDIHTRRMKMQEEWKEKCKQCEWIGDIPMTEVEKHVTKKDLWVVFNGFVYDFTQYVFSHPGGNNCFLPPHGRDITRQFYSVHRHVDPNLFEKLKIGKLV